MPIVLVTQVAKGLAYPVNGVIMGKKRITHANMNQRHATLK